MGANKEIPKDKIIEVLKKASAPLDIDLNITKDLVLLAKVELRLLMTLSNTRAINQWLAGAGISIKGHKIPNNFMSSGWEALLGFTIDNTRFYLSSSFIKYETTEFKLTKDCLKEVQLRNYWKEMPGAANMVHELRKNVLKFLNFYRKDQGLEAVANVEDIPASDVTDIINRQSFKLLALYALSIGHMPFEIQDIFAAGFQLAREYCINYDDFYRGLPVSGNSLYPSFLKDVTCGLPKYIEEYKYEKVIHFNDENGAKNFVVLKLSKASRCIFLPHSNWCQSRCSIPIGFPVMPEFRKIPLYGLDSIKKYNHAPIYLTEHLDVVGSLESDENHVWTSWYGGIESIEDVDWTPLRGRSVYYIIWEHEKLFEKTQVDAILKTAKKLVSKFYEDVNMHFKILIVNTQNGKEYVELVKESELIKIFSFNNIAIPKNLEKFKVEQINTKLRQKHPDEFLIRPVIKKESLTVLYASAGIGKTWLGLSIGLAIANGEDVFDGWRVSGKPGRVLYLLGEMSKEEIENRIFDLNKIYNKNINYSDNLRVCRKNYNLASSKDQRVVNETLKQYKAVSGEGYSLVIIDNLSTLVKNGTHQKAWDSFFKWVETLKDKKITVLLIHHANRGEKFLGTGSIKNMTDFMIRASRVDEIEQNLLKICNSKENKKTIERKKVLACLAPVMPSNGILMYLTHEKIRSLPESNSIPLKAVLSLENTPKWTCSKVNYEQILRELGISLDELYYDDIYRDDEQYENEQYENEDLKIKPIPYEHWKNIPENKFREVLIQCIADEGMTSTKIAARFKVSRSTVEKKREKTKTRKCDLLKEGLIKLKS